MFKRSQSNWSFELVLDRLELVPGTPRAVLGQSGCGKSTLLDLLSFSLYPNEVETFLIGTPTGALDIACMLKDVPDDLAFVRGRYMGYVLQQGGLLPFMTVRENIYLPAELFSVSNTPDINDLAETLGILGCLEKRPNSLSVGERQRAVIARAVYHRPRIIIADEPTASIDSSNSKQVARLLLKIAEQYKTALIVATHDHAVVSAMNLEPLKLETMASGSGTISIFRG